MTFHSDLENKVSHIVYRLRKNVKGAGERVPAQIEERRWRDCKIISTRCRKKITYSCNLQGCSFLAYTFCGGHKNFQKANKKKKKFWIWLCTNVWFLFSCCFWSCVTDPCKSEVKEETDCTSMFSRAIRGIQTHVFELVNWCLSVSWMTAV